MDSNTPRPVPPAATKSALLNLLSNTSMRLLQLQRRFDPLVRPAFDAVLRDPIARVVTSLINRQRTDEHFALAEERQLPESNLGAYATPAGVVIRTASPPPSGAL